VNLRDDLYETALADSPARFPSACLVETECNGDQLSEFGTDLDESTLRPVSMNTETFRIAWVDSYRLTRECIMKAFVELYPQLSMFPFVSIQDCIDGECGDLDLVIYHSHKLDADCLENITTLRQAYGTVPLIVLSDDDDAQQIKTIPDTLKSGAHGFISTRTTDIPMALAAMRFVKAGGTFAPLDLLMTKRPPTTGERPEAAPANQLTPRQTAVLSQVQQGKANKVIAYELGMSESTVKVHVRNIMRKMGATNRTQAVFKAQKIWLNLDSAQRANV
jgi:DNA-binding NarL/FixJ family response regulator